MPDEITALARLLDRASSIDSLQALQSCLASKKATVGTVKTVAVGLDANAFLKLANHPRRSDIIDYFATKHEAPLIIPGQVVQEFWNNQFSAMQSVSTGLKAKFDGLASDIAKVDARFGDFGPKVTQLMGELSEEFGYIRDPKTIGHLSSICEMLVAKARTHYVPRSAFTAIAAQRKRTRTPPGFKDDGDGDFFVWADFLVGLIRERTSGAAFDRCVLVTDDKKPDWSIGGIAHPILTAEVAALDGLGFELWSLDRLGKEVDAVLNEESAKAAEAQPNVHIEAKGDGGR